MKRLLLISIFLLAFESQLTANEIIRISAGRTHSMAIKSDNTLWVWGENTFGQLGNGKITTYSQFNVIEENNDLSVPAKLMENIVEIAAGSEFSLAVNQNGELFSWGRNDRGQLGDGSRVNRAMPKKILDNVVYIHAGSFAAVAVKSDNTLWVWGGADFTEKPVMIMNNVLKAVVVESSIIILDNEHQLFGIGHVRNLGIDDRRPNERIDSPVFIMNGIKDISAGRQSILALSYDSRLFGWGVIPCSSGRFNSRRAFLPELISDDVKKIFSENMFIRNDYSLWISGRISSTISLRTTIDGHGFDNGGAIIDFQMIQYGYRPVKLLNNIILACSSGFHKMAVDKFGNLFTWGNNQFGQLGNGEVSILGFSNDFEHFFFLQDNSVKNPTIVSNLFVNCL